MKRVSRSSSRDGIATVSSWTEINHGAVDTDVIVGWSKLERVHCPIAKV